MDNRGYGASVRIAGRGREYVLAAPRFGTLSQLCQGEYGGGETVFALSVALRSLGLPCHLPTKSAAMALDPINAANAINIAYRRTTTLRRHLCPLHLADEIPPLSFGTATVEQFSSEARSVGKERGSTCRSGGMTFHKKKKKE